MAFISVTYPNFVNGTVADGSQVSTDFSDVVNGLRDGTKDIAVNDGTFNGSVALGASSADTITVNGVVSGNIAGSGSLNAYGARSPGWVNNLGCTLAAGVFTVTDAAGAALSASNIGYVACPSTTAGLTVSLKVTAPATFNDDSHASSDLTNLGFGITEAADWAQDVPFFLYVVNKGNLNLDGVAGSSMFFLARNPCLTTTPSSADDIGDTGGIPVNDSKNVILILGDVTVADYVSLPCQMICGLRMRWSTTTDDWTVQTLSVASDGFGQTQLDKMFSKNWTMPSGQNGASSGAYLNANGGTAPVFTNNTYLYKVNRNGMIELFVHLDADGGTDGAGAVAAQLSLPVSVEYASTRSLTATIGFAFGATTIFDGTIIIGQLVHGNTYTELNYQQSTVDKSPLTNAMFSSGDRSINVLYAYPGFSG